LQFISRGEIHMLTQRYSRNFLKRVLVPRDRWHPWPTVADRRAWLGLAQATRRTLVRNGVEAMHAQWPRLPATLCLEFARNGNRSRFQAPYFDRRYILAKLALAECVENRGRFADPALNAIWSICEESTWSLPAHLPMQKAGAGLPDTAEPVVDLFAAETAAQLAWTAYLLGPVLDRLSALVVPRVHREIRDRILTPCLQRDDLWWMGFRSDHTNNWNPWINSNWLACILLVEPDPVRRLAAVAKSMRSLDVFIDTNPADGGCDEGPSYWTRAAASMFDCLELLRWASRGKMDVYGERLIREMGRYAYRAHLADNWVINFADAPACMTPPVGLVYRYGVRIRDRAMQSYAASFAKPASAMVTHIADNPTRSLPNLFDTAGFGSIPRRAPLPRDVWLPDLQVMVARSTSGTTSGLTLAAKGGHNGENHNHNDVGHFIVFADGKPLLVDAGVETYTRRTFSRDRYSIWTMQSQYHNLPTVNGVMQQDGREFRASDVTYSADGRMVSFSLDIAGAYPKAARLKKWRREFTFNRNGPIDITDVYGTAGRPRELSWSFVTPCKVHIANGVIRLRSVRLPHDRIAGSGRLLFDAARLKGRVERIPITDPQLKAIWGGQLFRIVLRAIHPAANDKYSLRVERL